MGFYGDFNGINGNLPSGKHTNIAIEHGPVEIVSFPPLKNGGSFQSYVSLPEGKHADLWEIHGLASHQEHETWISGETSREQETEGIYPLVI